MLRAMLTDQRRMFAYWMIQGLTGTEAAIKAGYSPPGAEGRAVELRRNPEIAAIIQAGQRDRVQRKMLTQDKLAVGLAELAFSDLSEVAGIRSLEDLKKCPPQVRRSVKSFKVRRSFRPGGRGEEGTEVEEVTVTMHDKLPAFAQLAKLLGLNDEVDQGAAAAGAAPTTLVQVLVNILGQQTGSVALAETVLPGEEV